MQVISRIFQISSIPYVVAAIVAAVFMLLLNRDSQWRKVFICVISVILFFFAWRILARIGSKRYAAIFIFFPVFALGMWLAQARTQTQKWIVRIILAGLFVCSVSKVFFFNNRYTNYTFHVANAIEEDLKNYPDAKVKILSFIDKGQRIAYWLKTEDLIVKEDVEGPPFYALRLNLNYWKYAADVTYVLFYYPSGKNPPTAHDLLLKDYQWEKIHESFVDNREVKTAYVFRYLPEHEDESMFELVRQLDNGNFEKVTSSIGFADRLIPMNVDYYINDANKVFPIDWNIFLNGYFLPGSNPELTCTKDALSGDYSLRLASDKSIFMYSSHAVNIAEDVYFSFEVIPKKESQLDVWMMTANKQDQTSGCTYKKIAVIPFSENDCDGKKHKLFFRMEPHLDGQNPWSRMAVELEHGEVILDNFQLERKTKMVEP